MARLVLSSVLIAALLCGCSTVHMPEADIKAQSAVLAEKFRDLSPGVDSDEAARAADAAIRYPLELAREYHATPPAIINNILINSGIHPRGLCYQWADDLTVKLITLHLHTLVLHRGVAKLDTRREHSCVVVTAPGQNFTNGIALDAWRYCGKLNWSSVTTDKYAWKEVNLIPGYQEELDAAAEKLEKESKQP